MFTAADHEFMSHALQLAEKGLFTANPNPRVGCVIANNDKVVGKGWHVRAGGPHAEVYALQEAGELARGATVYVTLEHCNHHGRTPPCVDALIQARVKKVVMAMDDPNPHVNGRGKERLQKAGIEIQTGLLADEAQQLNIGFVTRMRHGRPWVRAKIAASLDGRTALKNGESQWITDEPARRDGHKWRARSCAVLTGISSVNRDDPLLTVRHVKTSRQPVRVIADSNLEIPLQAKLLQNPETVWIFTARPDREKMRQLEGIGARVVILPDTTGRIDLKAMLMELGKSGINELLVEAGPVLSGALVTAGLVDEFIFYLAPNLLGNSAQAMLTLPELMDLSGKYNLQVTDLRKVGLDIRLIARF